MRKWMRRRRRMRGRRRRVKSMTRRRRRRKRRRRRRKTRRDSRNMRKVKIGMLGRRNLLLYVDRGKEGMRSFCWDLGFCFLCLSALRISSCREFLPSWVSNCLQIRASPYWCLPPK